MSVITRVIKNYKYACVVGVVVPAFAVVAFAQDRAVIVPGMKVLFENACVRVQYHDVA